MWCGIVVWILGERFVAVLYSFVIWSALGRGTVQVLMVGGSVCMEGSCGCEGGLQGGAFMSALLVSGLEMITKVARSSKIGLRGSGVGFAGVLRARHSCFHMVPPDEWMLPGQTR